MNNPLRHVGQTARPEDASTPDSQSGDAGSLDQHPKEKTGGADAKLPTPPTKKGHSRAQARRAAAGIERGLLRAQGRRASIMASVASSQASG